jgi:GNAT superfamily N-acetyltransferase
MTIREATPADAEIIALLVRELAAYEERSHQANPDVESLRHDLTRSDQRSCQALIAEAEGYPIGFALYYPTYSTFRTAWGIHLEDLYVREEYRSEGVGKALMAALANTASAENYRWIEWYVLAWNDDALRFYRDLGAREVDDWRMMMLSGSDLRDLAS